MSIDICGSVAAAAAERFVARDAVIGIIGLGYVGQPLALSFSAGGARVIGFDVNARVVEGLNAGRSFIEHIDGSDIEQALRNGFEATVDYGRIGEADS